MRGTRAIRGAEVTGSPHAHDGYNPLVATVAVFSWLPCTCWCEAEFVWVTQREVVYGSTRTCGRRACDDLAVGEPVPGDVIDSHAVPGGRVARKVDPAQTVEPTAPTSSPEVTLQGRRAPARVDTRSKDEMRERVHAVHEDKKRRRRATAWEAALRRDTVEELWRQGKDRWFIAGALGISYAMANNDLTYLKSKGRITMRPRQRKDQS